MPGRENSGPRRIRIFDTTLRDGEQAPGNAMRPEQKRELALALESVGVDVVEAGFPSSSTSDRTAVAMVAESLSAAHLGTLSRPVAEDIRIAVDAGGTERHHLQIMATGSETHLKYKRGIEQAQAQDEVVEAIGFARSLGVDNVTLAIEDASRGSDGVLRPLIVESIAAGANAVTVADTTGCLVPDQYGDLIRRIRSWIAPEIVVSTHCHEDLGLSLANALAGIGAGADEVQTTLAGIGERAGNTALEELIAVLTCNGDALGATTTAKPEGLYAAFGTLSSIIGLTQPRNKAIFGVNAFATQAGIHQAGMLRAPITYEYVDPALFGRQRSLLVGRHSGRAVLRYALGELGLPVDERLVDRVYTEQIENRTNGECVDLAGLRELMLATHAGVPGGGA